MSYKDKKPHPQDLCFKKNQYFLQESGKGSPMEYSSEINLKSREQFQRKTLTLSQMSNFRLSQKESVCRQQFNQNGRKFSKRVENTVGKGEIACYEQFLHFPQCFQRTCTADT